MTSFGSILFLSTIGGSMNARMVGEKITTHTNVYTHTPKHFLGIKEDILL